MFHPPSSLNALDIKHIQVRTKVEQLIGNINKIAVLFWSHK